MSRSAISPLSFVVVFVSLTCHLAAFVIYKIEHDAGPSFTQIDAQVLVLGSLLFIGIFASFYIDTRGFSRAILVLRLLTFIALCASYPTWFYVRLLILCALVFEIGIYEPFPASLFVVVTVVAASFASIEMFQMLTFGVNPAIISRSTIFFLLPTVIGVSTSFLTRYRESLIDAKTSNDHLNIAVSQLSQSNLLLQDVAFRAAQISRDSERHRIAREIHDIVGYTLTNLIMMMEAATDLVFDQPEKLQAIMQAARDQAKSGLEETRRSLRELREREDLPIRGLAAIQRLISAYDSVGSVEVDAEYGNAPASFGEEIDWTLFHFVQEGLTNSIRHGEASRISFRLWIEESILLAVIRDNGRGSIHVIEGIGLAGMRERAERLNGSIQAGNVADGFQTSLRLPYRIGVGS